MALNSGKHTILQQLYHTLSVAVNMTYQLVLLLLVDSVIGIPLQDFFPFNGPAVCLCDTSTGLVHTSNMLDINGVSVDDVNRKDCEEFRLTPNDDGSSYNINIKLGFPFFTKRFKNVFVSVTCSLLDDAA